MASRLRRQNKIKGAKRAPLPGQPLPRTPPLSAQDAPTNVCNEDPVVCHSFEPGWELKRSACVDVVNAAIKYLNDDSGICLALLAFGIENEADSLWHSFMFSKGFVMMCLQKVMEDYPGRCCSQEDCVGCVSVDDDSGDVVMNE
jgi:hypothetical protein